MKTNQSQSWGIALLRIAVGVVFLVHGSQKLFIYGFGGVAGAMAQMGIPLPGISAVLVTLAEFLGGACLLLGLFTRIAAVPLAVTMIVALAKVHLKGGFFLPNGFEYVLVLLAANIGLVLSGSGALALDGAIARKHSHLHPVQKHVTA